MIQRGQHLDAAPNLRRSAKRARESRDAQIKFESSARLRLAQILAASGSRGAFTVRRNFRRAFVDNAPGLEIGRWSIEALERRGWIRKVANLGVYVARYQVTEMGRASLRAGNGA